MRNIPLLKQESDKIAQFKHKQVILNVLALYPLLMHCMTTSSRPRFITNAGVPRESQRIA